MTYSTELKATSVEYIEGFELVGKRYTLLERDGEPSWFVQRRKHGYGRPWLRFVKKPDRASFRAEYWVTAWKTLRDAKGAE